MIKNLKHIRISVQIIFILLTVSSIKLFKPLPVKLTIFAISFLVGAYYCGWVCCFGSIQSIIRKLGKKYIKKDLIIPEKYNKFLLYFRYITLFISLGYFITFTDGRKTFLNIINGKSISYIAVVIMGMMLVLSLFMERPFCKYLCPEGARYGAIGLARIFTITRNNKTCINCTLCDKECPMTIKVSTITSMNNPHCISCGECINKCPIKGTLSLKFRNIKDPKILITFIIGIYFLYNTTVYILNKFGN